MLNAGSLSPSMRGIAAMSLAAVILTIHDTGTKLLLEHYAITQLVTLRQSFSLILLLFIVQFTTGWGSLRVGNKSAVGNGSSSSALAATTAPTADAAEPPIPEPRAIPLSTAMAYP